MSVTGRLSASSLFDPLDDLRDALDSAGGAIDDLDGRADDVLDALLDRVEEEDLPAPGGSREVFVGGPGADVVFGEVPDDAIGAFDGALLFGRGGGDTLVGTARRDLLAGGAGDDAIAGGGGGDAISGNSGADDLDGGRGSDAISGGRGADVIVGGRGADVLEGGRDADSFVFLATGESRPGSRDLILDFGRGGDLLDLAAVDANSGLGGNQAFAFIRGASFSGAAGELRFDDGRLDGDTDGDGAADLRIRLAGVDDVAAEDLLL